MDSFYEYASSTQEASRASLRLIPIQILNKTPVLEFIQDRRIDEVLGVEVFHFPAGLGKLVDDHLDAFAPAKLLTHQVTMTLAITGRIQYSIRTGEFT